MLDASENMVAFYSQSVFCSFIWLRFGCLTWTQNHPLVHANCCKAHCPLSNDGHEHFLLHRWRKSSIWVCVCMERFMSHLHTRLPDKKNLERRRGRENRIVRECLGVRGNWQAERKRTSSEYYLKHDPSGSRRHSASSFSTPISDWPFTIYIEPFESPGAVWPHVVYLYAKKMVFNCIKHHRYITLDSYKSNGIFHHSIVGLVV